MADSQIFAIDSFYTAGGKLDIGSTEPLSVAFIGGSLTEGEIDYEGTSLEDGRLKWANVVLKFLGGLFPFRRITAVNAGLGGTRSEYGAIRFERDVLSSSPDIVFIEFSCNDRATGEAGFDEAGKRDMLIYLESMIRQCMAAKKVPVIIYQHVPLPLDNDVLRYYRKGCELKQELLDYYSIGTVDAMADVMAEFEAQKKANPSLTLRDFYMQYYKLTENGSFDVHPYASGYMLFAVSVINALAKHPEKYFKAFEMKKELFCDRYADIIGERYSYVPASSERITHFGEWTLHTAENKYESDDPELLIREAKYVQKHQFHEGIMQTFTKNGAGFSFETEADRITMPHVSAKAGRGATVYADGAKVGSITCRSRWHGMNYFDTWVDLPKGKKTVRFEIEDASCGATVFRYGYIVEAFRK